MSSNTSEETKSSLGKNDVSDRILKNLSLILKGKDEVLFDLLVAVISGVHVLLEDVPGVGKTTLAKGLARSVKASFRRVQFTPDLLPADVLGSSMYNPKEGEFFFREGPVFTNILLADEINRASPRTQSSLLEAMSERQVTIEGTRYPLSDFFIVIATQNPVEFHGTYPLPEAQLDRFGMTLSIGYPDVESEIEVYYSQNQKHPLEDLTAIADIEDIVEIQDRVKKVKVSRPVAEYIARIAEESRKHKDLKLGVSPRGTLMLYRIIQARALLLGRDYATPDDVKSMGVKTLAHRLLLGTKARYSGITKRTIIQEVLSGVPVPT